MEIFTRLTNPPPPIPWIARAEISIPMLEDVAAMRDPAKNTTFAASKIGFRPKISDTFAQIGAADAEPSIYAEPIHVYPFVELKWLEIVGRAVAMMVCKQ